MNNTTDDQPELYGAVAQHLAAQAAVEPNPALAQATMAGAWAASQAERDTKAKAMREQPFARVPVLVFWLPISPSERLVLGRVYSYQLTTNRSGKQAEYRMSLDRGAAELGLSKRWMQQSLYRLVKMGLLRRERNGNRPSTYTVDEAACYDMAVANGWVPPEA